MINQNARLKIEKIKMQLKTVDERRFLDQMTDLLEHLLEDNQKLRNAAVETSWKLNPDRMGGQFTEEEINHHRDDRW